MAESPPPKPNPPDDAKPAAKGKKVQPYKPGRSRAAKAIGAIEGDDDFSVSGAKKRDAKPLVNLKPKIDEAPLPRNAVPPSRERNLFIRLYAKIFR